LCNFGKKPSIRRKRTGIGTVCCTSKQGQKPGIATAVDAHFGGGSGLDHPKKLGATGKEGRICNDTNKKGKRKKKDQIKSQTGGIRKHGQGTQRWKKRKGGQIDVEWEGGGKHPEAVR